MRSKVTVILAGMALGCAGADSTCDVAQTRVEECLGAAPSNFAEECVSTRTPEAYEAIVSMSCDELRNAAAAKADGFLGWLGEGEGCSFNWQCEDELVCVPDGPLLFPWEHHGCHARSGPKGYCDRPGLPGLLRWDGDDCRDGYRCAEALYVDRGGFPVSLPSSIGLCARE